MFGRCVDWCVVCVGIGLCVFVGYYCSCYWLMFWSELDVFGEYL